MAGAITRWNPFGEFSELRSQFDRMIDEMYGTPSRAWQPPVDVVRKDNNLILRADIPGIKPEDVKIEVDNDILTVTGRHEETNEEKEGEYLRRERRYGSFQRSMALPAGVDPDQIKAETHHGVIEITIPLPKPHEKHKVQITPTAS